MPWGGGVDGELDSPAAPETRPALTSEVFAVRGVVAALPLVLEVVVAAVLVPDAPHAAYCHQYAHDCRGSAGCAPRVERSNLYSRVFFSKPCCQDLPPHYPVIPISCVLACPVFSLPGIGGLLCAGQCAVGTCLCCCLRWCWRWGSRCCGRHWLLLACWSCVIAPAGVPQCLQGSL